MTLAEHDSDINIKACTKIRLSFVTRFCAYNLLRYQVSVYRTIGPLVFNIFHAFRNSRNIDFVLSCKNGSDNKVTEL